MLDPTEHDIYTAHECYLGKSCPNHEILTSQLSIPFNAIRKNEILAKISEFSVLVSC